MSSFAIVLFLEEGEDDEVALVPQNWCIGDECFWPPYRRNRLQKAIRNCESVQSGWVKYPIRLMKTTDSYDKGRKLEKMAEDTSDLQTEAEEVSLNGKRRKISNRRYLTSDSSSSEEDLNVTLPRPALATLGGQAIPTPSAGNTNNSTHAPAPAVTKPTTTSAHLSGSASPPPPATENHLNIQNSIPSPSRWHTSVAAPTQSQINTTPQSHTSRPHVRSTSSASVDPSTSASPPPPATENHLNIQNSIPSPSRWHTSVAAPTQSQINTTPQSHTSRPHVRSTSSASVDPSTSASQRLLIKLITELKTELKEVRSQVQLNTALLQSLQTRTQGADDEEPQLPDGVAMPFATLEEFVAFDEELKTNREYKKYLLKLWSTTGGRDLASATKRTLNEVMANDVAKQLNWTGQGNKRSFKDLNMRPILEKAFRKNKWTVDCTAEDIQNAVSHFLKGAKDREGGRRARRSLPTTS